MEYSSREKRKRPRGPSKFLFFALNKNILIWYNARTHISTDSKWENLIYQINNLSIVPCALNNRYIFTIDTSFTTGIIYPLLSQSIFQLIIAKVRTNDSAETMEMNMNNPKVIDDNPEQVSCFELQETVLIV